MEKIILEKLHKQRLVSDLTFCSLKNTDSVSEFAELLDMLYQNGELSDYAYLRLRSYILDELGEYIEKEVFGW